MGFKVHPLTLHCKKHFYDFTEVIKGLFPVSYALLKDPYKIDLLSLWTVVLGCLQAVYTSLL